jgi:hypothetical protein
MIKLIDKISPLPGNVYDYKLIDVLKADIITDRAARLEIKVGEKCYIFWFPLSALAKDRNNNIWLKKWFYEQKFEKKN